MGPVAPSGEASSDTTSAVWQSLLHLACCFGSFVTRHSCATHSESLQVIPSAPGPPLGREQIRSSWAGCTCRMQMPSPRYVRLASACCCGAAAHLCLTAHASVSDCGRGLHTFRRAAGCHQRGSQLSAPTVRASERSVREPVTFSV